MCCCHDTPLPIHANRHPSSGSSYCPQPRHVFHAHACLFALAIKSCACRAPKRTPQLAAPPPLHSHPLLAGVAFIVRCTSLVLSQLVFYFGISEFGFISLRFLFIFRRSQVQQFSQSPLGEVERGSQSREDSWSMWIMWIIVDRRLLPSTMHGKARRRKGAKSRGDLPKLFASLWYLKTRDG